MAATEMLSHQREIHIRRMEIPMDYLKDDERPTCVAATTKVLVVGTSMGKVVLCSPEGYIIKVHEYHGREAISTISLSLRGDQCVSCALTGNIAVQDLFDEKRADFIQIEEPPLCSVWRPLKKKLEIAIGTVGGHVIVIKRKMLGGLSSQVIFEDDLRQEPVSAIAWNSTGDRLCFSTYHAAYVYDPANNAKLLVAFHSPAAPESAPPVVHWLSNRQIIMSRGKRLDWCQVGLLNLKVTKRLDINEEVCMLSQLDAHCLACTKEEDRNPKMVVFDANGSNLYECEIPILDEDDEDIATADFRYCHCADEQSLEDWYYLMTPDRLVLCKHERDFNKGDVVSF